MAMALPMPMAMAMANFAFEGNINFSNDWLSKMTMNVWHQQCSPAWGKQSPSTSSSITLWSSSSSSLLCCPGSSAPQLLCCTAGSKYPKVNTCIACFRYQSACLPDRAGQTDWEIGSRRGRQMARLQRPPSTSICVLIDALKSVEFVQFCRPS